MKYKNSIFAFFLIFFIFGSILEAKVIFVDKDATGNESGSSWANACKSISKGIIYSKSSDEIWVSEGKYNESITINDGLKLFGGFKGNETIKTERNWKMNLTIINKPSTMSSAVKMGMNSVLDGFIVKGENNNYLTTPSGYGIYIGKDNISEVRNCIIKNNWYCEGIFCTTNSSPTIINCIITGNFGDQSGGVYLYCSKPSFINCTITGNGGYSGAIRGYFSTALIKNCIIWCNAGGSYFYNLGKLNFQYCCIEGGAPGEGNFDKNPCFVGWGEKDTIYFDAATSSTGDGNRENPYPTIDKVQFNFTLGEDSPCSGSGENGNNIGADWGFCGKKGNEKVTLVFAKGTYNIGELSCFHNISIQGERADNTILRGSVAGLRDNCYMKNVTISNGKGSGFASVYESPTISDCRIINNKAFEGGGIYCFRYSSARFYYTTIANNEAISRLTGGGGIFDNNSDNKLYRCIITKNKAGGYSGGVHIVGSQIHKLELNDCIISENTANQGAGIGNFGDAVFNRCIISKNNSGSYGGGIYIRGSSFHDQSNFINCLISNNIASGEYGGGIYGLEGRSKFINCTIVYNHSLRYGHGVYMHQDSNLEFTNCIIYHNSYLHYGKNFDGDQSDISYSCVEGLDYSSSGEENIYMNPNLNDTYHLNSNSPCINLGTTSGASSRDLDRNPRPSGSKPDMGCYEYNPNLPKAPSNPNPPNGLLTAPITTDFLDWNDSSKAQSYDIYFWNSTTYRPTRPTTNTLESSYFLSTILPNLTNYKWQVVAKNEIGIMPGPIWTFRIYITSGFLSEYILKKLFLLTAYIKECDQNTDGKIDVSDIIKIVLKEQ